jgi:hypothetical protein
MIFIGIGQALTKAAKWANWQIGSDMGRRMLDQVYETQKDRLEHQYEAERTRIAEGATTLSGQQTTALAAMGQAGGVDTAGAGVLAHTEARKTSDLGLLDTSYQDAVADLTAQYNLAVQEQSEKLAYDVEASIANLAKIGVGSMSLGMQGSRSTLLGDSDWIKPETGAYTWGLLG